MCPDNSKIPYVATVDLCEDAIEDITQKMATETCNNGFTTAVAMDELVLKTAIVFPL